MVGALVFVVTGRTHEVAAAASDTTFDTTVRAILERHCYGCHNPKKAKAGLDLQTLSADDVLPNHRLWKTVAQRVELGTMPPGDKPGPTDEERKLLAASIRQAL